MKEVDNSNGNIIFKIDCLLPEEDITNPNEHQNLLNNIKSNKGLNNIFERFSFDYFGANLNPDFFEDDIYYFFFPNTFIRELETILNDSINNYPYTFEPIKDDLLKFSKEKQEKEFNKKIGFFSSLKREILIKLFSENNSKNERIKAKKVAYLLSQLNDQKNKTDNMAIYIAYFNKNDSKLCFDCNSFFENIYNNFSLDIFKNDDNKNIFDLSLKIARFKECLVNESKFEYKKKLSI